MPAGAPRRCRAAIASTRSNSRPLARAPRRSRPAATSCRRSGDRVHGSRDEIRAGDAPLRRRRRGGTDRAPGRAPAPHGTARRASTASITACGSSSSPRGDGGDVAARGEDPAIEAPAVHAHQHRLARRRHLGGARRLLDDAGQVAGGIDLEQRERLDPLRRDVARPRPGRPRSNDGQRRARRAQRARAARRRDRGCRRSAPETGRRRPSLGREHRVRRAARLGLHDEVERRRRGGAPA